MGYGAFLLAKRAARVLAIDVDAQTIAFARQRWAQDNLSFEIGNLHCLKLGTDDLFDRVIAFEVLEHLVDPPTFLKALWPHVADGGKVLVSSPNEAELPHTIELNPFHIRHYTVAELQSLAVASGFILVSVHSQDDEHISDDESQPTLLAIFEKGDRPAAEEAKLDLSPVLEIAERELVERAKVIKGMACTIARADRLRAVLPSLDRREIAAVRKNIDLLKGGCSDDSDLMQGFLIADTMRHGEITRLRESERIAMAELIRLDGELGRLGVRCAEAERRERESDAARRVLRDRLNEARAALEDWRAEAERREKESEAARRVLRDRLNKARAELEDWRAKIERDPRPSENWHIIRRRWSRLKRLRVLLKNVWLRRNCLMEQAGKTRKEREAVRQVIALSRRKNFPGILITALFCQAHGISFWFFDEATVGKKSL